MLAYVYVVGTMIRGVIDMLMTDGETKTLWNQRN